MSRFSSLAVLGLLLIGCKSSATSEGGEPPATAATAPSPAPASSIPAPMPEQTPAQPKPVALDVAATQKVPAGTAIEVVGLYLGWSGPCKGEPPTRSAWQIADAAQVGAPCLYVDGPMVPGVAPNSPPPGLKVRVKGVVRGEGAAGYLEAKEITKE